MYRQRQHPATFPAAVQETLIVLAGSAIIGAAVALPVIIGSKAPLLPALARSVLTALVIGAFAAAAFTVLYRIIARKPLSGFLAVFFIILAGTVLGSLLGGERMPSHIFLMTFFAEAFGMAMCAYMFRKTVLLNNGLSRKQRQLKENSGS